MWPMGHVAIAYLLYTASTRARFEESPAAGPTLVVVFGSLFPDLVDKPLAWYLGVLPTGRTLAHSLLVLVPLCLAIYIVARARDREEYAVAFAIGALSHSLVDALPVLWDGDASVSFLLWPYWAVEPYEEGVPTVFELLLASLSDPYFLSEFLFLAVALAVWRADGYPGLTLLERVWPGRQNSTAVEADEQNE